MHTRLLTSFTALTALIRKRFNKFLAFFTAQSISFLPEWFVVSALSLRSVPMTLDYYECCVHLIEFDYDQHPSLQAIGAFCRRSLFV